MRNTIFLILTIVLFFSACAKEDLVIDPIQSEPLFKVDLEKDNESFLIEAGKNEFYLFTDYDFDQSSNEFSPLSSFSKVEDCTSDCEEAFTIQIHNVSVENKESFFGKSWEGSNFQLRSTTDVTGNISVCYTNADGITYSSNLGPQSSSAVFNVTDIQSYLKNEKDQDTKLIYSELDCMLYDESGNSISISNGKLVFAIAVL